MSDIPRIAEDLLPDRTTETDAPTVCVAHGASIPCRKRGEHRYTSNPYWVKSVRDYQTSTIEGLTWEPAWPDHAADHAADLYSMAGSRVCCCACACSTPAPDKPWHFGTNNEETT